MSRKRGQNEGSIYKRRDGRWEAMLNLGWKDGRRLRRSFYGATRAAVQEQLLKALHERDQGLPVAVERQTTGQFLDHWLERSLRQSARPRSYEIFETLIRLHIRPSLGKVCWPWPRTLRRAMGLPIPTSPASPKSKWMLRPAPTESSITWLSPTWEPLFTRVRWVARFWAARLSASAMRSARNGFTISTTESRWPSASITTSEHGS